jgi:hypothetical protein
MLYSDKFINGIYIAIGLLIFFGSLILFVEIFISRIQEIKENSATPEERKNEAWFNRR